MDKDVERDGGVEVLIKEIVRDRADTAEGSAESICIRRDISVHGECPTTRTTTSAYGPFRRNGLRFNTAPRARRVGAGDVLEHRLQRHAHSAAVAVAERSPSGAVHDGVAAVLQLRALALARGRELARPRAQT